MSLTVRSFVRDDRGGTALDMALVMPVYLLIILGIFAVSFLLWTENCIQYAVEQAARCASVDVIDCGTAGVPDATKVQNAAIAWTYGILTSADTAKVTVNLGVACAAGITGNAVAIHYSVTFFVISTSVAAEACYPLLT
jgi:Flp pilus assembly protein TadG